MKRDTSDSVAENSEKPDASGIRVIARAAEILKALGQYSEGLTLSEIANQVKLPRSTVHRIVNALDAANLVIAASPTSGVRLGPALISLANSAKKFDVVAEIARPLLAQLSKDLGETVDFAILANGKAVVVDQIPGNQPLVAVSANVGTSLPLHASSTGKALLAALSPEELADYRKRLDFRAYTENTIRSWAELVAELAKVRAKGLAYDRDEYLAGISCVGKVIIGPGGELGAVSIPVPSERFVAIEETLVQALVDRCDILQRRFSR